MNAFLLSVGIGILVVLAAALSAPFILDWSTQRGFFERQASNLLGQQVEMAGPIDVVLLPEPRFSFQDVTIGEPDAEHVIRVGEIAIRLTLGELLKGRVEIQAAQIADPEFSVGIAESGQLSVPALLQSSEFDPARVAAESIDFAGGAITVREDATGREIFLDQINGTGTVRALNGPYKFVGGFRSAGRRFELTLSTGTRSAEKIPIALSLTPSDFPLSLELEGETSLVGGVPAFQGAAEAEFGTFDEETARFVPFWRSIGRVGLTVDRMLFRDAEITLGPADRELKLSGIASMPWDPSDPLDIVLSGRQLDLDRFFGAGPDEPAKPAEVLRAANLLAQAISGSVVGSREVSLGLDATALVLGGDIVQDFSAQFGFEEGSVAIEGASATLPGTTSVALNGLVTEQGQGFDGVTRIEAVNPAAALRWVSDGRLSSSPEAARAMSGLLAEANVNLSSTGLQIEGLSGEIQGAPISAEVEIVYPTDDQPGAMDVLLQAASLALPDLPLSTLLGGDADEQAPFFDWLNTYAIEARLNVESLRTSESLVRGIETDLSFNQNKIDIRRLSIANVLGAQIAANGSIFGWPTEPEGAVSLDVSAPQLDQLYPVITEGLRLVFSDDAPAALPENTADAATLARFEPFAMSAEIGAVLDQDGARLTVNGTGNAASSEVEFQAESQISQERTMDRFLAVDLTFANGGSQALLEQFGFSPLDDATAGADSVASEISVLANGVPSQGMEMQVQGRVLDLDFFAGGSGRIVADGSLQSDLELGLETADHRALASYLGVPVDDVLRKSGAAQARVAFRGETLTLDDINGRFAGTAISGRMRVEPEGDTRRYSLDMVVDEADLSALLSPFVGPEPGIAATAARIEDRVFGSSAGGSQVPLTIRTLSDRHVDFAIKAGQLTVSEGVTAREATIELTSRDGRVQLDTIEGRLLGGTLEGQGAILPSPTGVAINLQSRLEGLDMVALTDTVLDRSAGFAGAGTFDIQIKGQGATPQAILGSLSGDGRFEIENATVANLNPQAFPLVVRASDAGLDLESIAVRDVFQSHLDAGRLRVPRAEGAFTIVGGVARISNVVVDGDQASLRASGAIDVAEREIDVGLSLSPSGSGIVTDTTEVTVRYAGPFAAIERAVDVDGLVGYLNVRRFEREVERVEALQADILERQRLAREIVIHNQQLAALEAAEAAAEAERAAQEAAERAATTRTNTGNTSTDQLRETIRSILEDQSDALAPPVSILPDSLVTQ
ncbi:MAG: AsmA-like C-terminal region-containing protein [Pseudomonadota bacterium]